MIAIENCIKLVVKGLDIHTYGSNERLIRAARGQKIGRLKATSSLKKKKEKGFRIGNITFYMGSNKARLRK